LHDAIVHYTQAIRLRPDYAEAHNNLGVALAQQGKREQAVVHFSQALRLKPDDEAVRNNLQATLAQ